MKDVFAAFAVGVFIAACAIWVPVLAALHHVH